MDRIDWMAVLSFILLAVSIVGWLVDWLTLSEALLVMIGALVCATLSKRRV